MQVSNNGQGICNLHGVCFGPFGQMFNKYQDVSVSFWCYWQGSNYVYSPSLEDVSGWGNRLQRGLIVLLSLILLADVTLLDDVSDLCSEIGPMLIIFSNLVFCICLSLVGFLVFLLDEIFLLLDGLGNSFEGAVPRYTLPLVHWVMRERTSTLL